MKWWKTAAPLAAGALLGFGAGRYTGQPARAISGSGPIAQQELATTQGIVDSTYTQARQAAATGDYFRASSKLVQAKAIAERIPDRATRGMALDSIESASDYVTELLRLQIALQNFQNLVAENAAKKYSPAAQMTFENQTLPATKEFIKKISRYRNNNITAEFSRSAVDSAWKSTLEVLHGLGKDAASDLGLAIKTAGERLPSR